MIKEQQKITECIKALLVAYFNYYFYLSRMLLIVIRLVIGGLYDNSHIKYCFDMYIQALILDIGKLLIYIRCQIVW